ncbi:iron complex outermembrane recepter protein [Salinimicrobium sediminis]|uniref:Iron complex outermembrane recepter protein n=1 Tax=Salinimicrobium sediminis TaxID=1343891 RepID=A0A285X6D2_9FLAO|nr:TonB-dependent receptor [Salinimicrobium sediminis]SOC80901.1 iron complex outermembrane recepter protein [Salinimicrobium sediminis]
MKKILSFICLLLFFQSTTAQKISGRIIDAFTNEPLENVNISAEGSLEATFSDASGSFYFPAESFPLNLIFEMPGYGRKILFLKTPEDDLLIYMAPAEGSLAEVVLRSTIIPQELLETPASVSVLSSSDLERFDETNLMQNFSTVAGVNVHQGALNTNKMSIRGVGARSQYSTNRVKAYFMEIPISSAEGETTLDDLDPAMIGRAEIIKGPVSSVYGAGLGGVITLLPAEAESGTHVGAKTTFGSYGLIKGNFKASHASETTNVVATYNHLQSDGWRENGAYNRDGFTVYGKFSGGEKNLISVFGNFVRLKAFIPSSVNKETLENDPSSAAFTWAAAQGYESYDKGLFGISNTYRFSPAFENVTSGYFRFRDAYEPRPFDILNEGQFATGARTKFSFENPFFEADSQLSIGAEVYREWYDTATFENLYGEFEGQGSIPGNILSNNEQDRRYYNLFAQYNIEILPKLQLEAGVNLNSTSYELNDVYAEDEIDQSGDYRFETVLSPRLGAVYSLKPAKNFYASISHGFSTPTVAETLTPEGLINTSLQPETGINYEIGFKGNFFNNRLYAEVAAFSIQVEDLLVSERVAEDQYIGRNAGRTDHNGLELLLNYNFKITNNLRARSFVNAAFNSFKFDEFVDEGEDFSGNNLPAVPQKTLNAGLDFLHTSGISLRATWQHEGEMPLNDANSEFREGYNLLNLKTSWTSEIFSNWSTEICAGLNNVLDEAYAASVIPNAVGFGGTAPRYFYPGMPRNWFGGLAIEYNF